MDPLVRKKLVNSLVEELKTSSYRGSDADWYIGFTPDQETANENEYDPKTGKIVNNTEVGNHATFLNQWDADNTGFLEEDDIERDSGTFNNRLPLNMFQPYESKKPTKGSSRDSRKG